MVHLESSVVTAEAPLVTLQAPERSELNRPLSLYPGGLIPRGCCHIPRGPSSPLPLMSRREKFRAMIKGGDLRKKGRYLESDRWINAHHRSTKHA